MNSHGDFSKYKNNMKAAEFRGYMTAKVEDLIGEIKGLKKSHESRDADIAELKKYMIQSKAVAKVKGSIWGTLGGFFGAIIAFVARYFIFKE